MPYRCLYIWVEGSYDDLFFDRVMRPPLECRYDLIQVVQYAEEEPAWRRNYLRNIQSRQDASYIYVTDLNAAPCVTAKKEDVRGRMRQVEADRVMVVVPEIEGWYLAGLNAEHSARLGIGELVATDQITKEEFTRLRPRGFESNRELMLEILGCFSVAAARAKNASFDYFCRKFLPAEAQ